MNLTTILAIFALITLTYLIIYYVLKTIEEMQNEEDEDAYL